MNTQDSVLLKRIGSRIRVLRKNQKIDQRTMAKEIGITPSALCQVERGSKGLSAANLSKAAKFLKVPESVLMSEADVSEEALIAVSKFFELATRDKKSKNWEAILALIDLDLAKKK